MGEENDLVIYLDGTDVKAVAAAARRLDATAFFRDQMSYAELQASIQRSDEEIFAEREENRIKEETARKEQAIAKLQELRNAWYG